MEQENEKNSKSTKLPNGVIVNNNIITPFGRFSKNGTTFSKSLVAEDRNGRKGMILVIYFYSLWTIASHV